MNFLNRIKTRSTAVIVLLTFFSTSAMFAQDRSKTEETKFLIGIEISGDNELKMECKKGCSWETLTYKNPGQKQQVINENGMVSVEKNEQKSSEFLFSIKKVGNELFLKGIKDTHWTSLNLKLLPNKKIWFTETGTINSRKQ